MKIKVLFLIFLIMALGVFAKTADCATEHEISSVWKQSHKPVLILGEASHGDQRSIELLKSLVALEWKSIEFIALESDSSEQAVIDAYLNSTALLPSRLNGSATRDLSLLATIKKINQKRTAVEMPPIDVIAMDLPGNGFDSREAWFGARDKYMSELLISKTESFSRPGIVFTGAGHAARFEYRLQTLLRLAMRSISSVTPLGANPLLQTKSLSVFLQTEYSLGEKLPMLLFGDTRPFVRLSAKMKAKSGELIRTQSSRFMEAERALGVTDNTPMKLSTHFDYWVQLTRAANCSQALSRTEI